MTATTAQEHYKIVDTFNGYEGPTFQTEDEAFEEVERRREAFYQHQGNRTARFCQTVVPASYTWAWNQRQNTFIWSD